MERSVFPVDEDYLSILDGIMESGTVQPDRTNIGESKQVFAETLWFDTCGEAVPFIQCRTFAPRIAFHEWKWMIGGSTDSTYLEDRGIHIWSAHTSREFLDSRGLHDLPVGSVGKSYGHQFRNFGGVDQVQGVYDSLKNDPMSRRHIVSIWNPAELDAAPLAPCAFLYEFMVEGDELHLHQHMRSADVPFGVPYNMAFSAFWLFSFAQALGYKPGKYWLTMTNAHVYKNQYEIVDTMLETWAGTFATTGTQRPVPKLSFTKPLNSLEDILALEWEDVVVTDWVRGPKIGDAEIAL